MKKNFRHLAGYTLVELAVVLGVMGLITGSILSVATTRKESQNFTNINTHYDAIEDAIQRYVIKYGYLPCPASNKLAENTASFGRSDCATAAGAGTGFAESGAGTDIVRIGVVPTRTLGLPDSYMYDPWNDRIDFAVIKSLTTSSAAFNAYTTALTTGVIKIVDYNGNQVTNASADTVVSYILISHGKDTKGAYNRLGTLVTACNAAAKDGENCNNDVIFRDTSIANSTTAANYYDDYVRWKEKARWLGGTTTPAASFTVAGDGFLVAGGAGDHCVGKTSDGTVWCWGYGAAGQTGNGSGTDQHSPVQVSGLSGIVEGDANDIGGCALKKDGTIWCWGGWANNAPVIDLLSATPMIPLICCYINSF